MNPLFSVIIPTYNRAELLKKSIQSVLNQSFDNWELIIVVDGSTDETQKMVSSFDQPNVHYFYQKNKERSQARNYGIEKAKGKYICFMDDDDFYLENHLENFFQFLSPQNFPKIILRSGFYRERRNERMVSPNFDKKLHKNPVAFSAFNMCGVWSLCIPSEFLEEEKFPINFPHWQDTHLILRLFAKYPFHQLNTYSYIYRIHEEMGSIKLFTKEDFIKRMQLNLEAIQHLFNNYNNTISPFLPKKTKNILLAEKQLQYAIRAIPILGKRESYKLFKRALDYKFSLRFWRYYLSFFKRIIIPFSQ